MSRARLVVLVAALGGLPLAVTAQEPPPPAPEPGRAARPPIVAPAEAWEGVEKAPARLAHRWKEGQRLTTTARQSVLMDQGALGRMEMEMLFVTDDVVTRAPDEGGATITSRYRDMVYELSVAGQRFAIDTREGATRSGNPVVDAMALMTGGEVAVDLGPRGDVQRVTGAPALVERMVAGVPPQLQARLRQALAGSMNDERLREQLQESYVVFAEEELQPGEGWSREYQVKLDPMGLVDYAADYLYLGLVDRDGVRCAKVIARVSCAGCAEREVTLDNGVAARGAVTPFQAESALLIRLSDGLVVEMAPRSTAFDVDLKVQGELVRTHMEMTVASTMEDAAAAAASGSTPR